MVVVVGMVWILLVVVVVQWISMIIPWWVVVLEVDILVITIYLRLKLDKFEPPFLNLSYIMYTHISLKNAFDWYLQEFNTSQFLLPHPSVKSTHTFVGWWSVSFPSSYLLADQSSHHVYVDCFLNHHAFWPSAKPHKWGKEESTHYQSLLIYTFYSSYHVYQINWNCKHSSLQYRYSSSSSSSSQPP